MTNVTTQVDAKHVERFRKDCEYYADEPVTAEKIKDTLYVYGSELACRRIEHTFRHTDTARKSFGYSKNLETWFFGLTINN